MFVESSIKMPRCKNDPKTNYKTSAPSPNGFGFCSHAEKIGTIKKGTDGNKWIVKTDKNGKFITTLF
jgi:hypothetical protein